MVESGTGTLVEGTYIHRICIREGNRKRFKYIYMRRETERQRGRGAAVESGTGMLLEGTYIYI